MPPEEGEAEPVKKYGKTCEPSVAGAVTANQTLIQWLPKKLSIDDLRNATSDDKIEPIPGTDHAKVRVAYQMPTEVTWSDAQASLCGRTLEVSFGLENAAWCQDGDRRPLGLNLRGQIATPGALATGLHKRVIGQYFDKTKFALGVLARTQKEWTVPRYIAEGLKWLQMVVDLETEQEVQAAAESIAVEAVEEPAGGAE